MLSLLFVLLSPTAHADTMKIESGPPPAPNVVYSAPGNSAQEIVFKDRGEVIRTMPLAEMFNYVTNQDIKVFDPYESAQRIYKTLPLDSLLYAVFGERWRKREEIRFLRRKGIELVLPKRKVLRFEAYLAYARPPVAEFKVRNPEGGNKIFLGPFALIWDNLKYPELQAQGIGDWATHIVGIELLDMKEHYPRTYPAQNSAVLPGFWAYREYCGSCHTINGEGPGNAQDLNRPVSPTEYLKEAYLTKWIVDPKSIRPGTVMPPLPLKGKERDEVSRTIIAYLKEMARVRH